MATILYGVAGEGSGHASRAREIVRHLKRKKHTVKFVSSARGYKNLRPDFDVERIFGFSFSFKDNKVRYAPTILHNLLKTPEAIEGIEHVSKIADAIQPDIIISDFEPIVSTIAHLKKIPLISIDNQHRLTNTKIEYPKKYRQEALTAQTVINLITFHSSAYLVTAFSKAIPTKKDTYIFPPILREAVLQTKPRTGDYILVYLTSGFNKLTRLLETVNKKFIIYGLNREEKRNNLIVKKSSRKGFLKDLAGCEGVIASAGFTLITESLYLGKPYLALPITGQFEQIFNAHTLETLGYGQHWDELNKERIESFLYNIETYKKNLTKYKKEDNSKICKKIDELIAQYTRQKRKK